MRKLSTKTNVIAPDSDYPFGRIKNNPGDNSGTPVNEQVYGDFHQFFEKLMSDAGIVANGLPENNYSGFQLNQALEKLINGRDQNWISSVLTTSLVKDQAFADALSVTGSVQYRRGKKETFFSIAFSANFGSTPSIIRVEIPANLYSVIIAEPVQVAGGSYMGNSGVLIGGGLLCSVFPSGSNRLTIQPSSAWSGATGIQFYMNMAIQG